MCDVGIPREETVEREGAALSIIDGTQNDEAVFDGDDKSQSPDDDGQRANQVLCRWLAGEGRRVNVTRRCPHVAVDDTSGLEAEPDKADAAVAL